MLVPDGHGLLLVFQDFDPHAVRCLDIGLVDPVAVAREHRYPGRLPLCDALLHIVDNKPNVVDH